VASKPKIVLGLWDNRQPAGMTDSLIHAIDGTWPKYEEDRLPIIGYKSGGAWTTRAKHAYCGQPSEGCYSWLIPIERVTCPDCQSTLAAALLIKTEFVP